jgi:aspartate racemase
MHIGLIGGIGPAATERYYRGLIKRHSHSEAPLDLTIVHADVRQLATNLSALAKMKQAEVFASLIQRLAGAGAELAAVSSMGGHFCINELQAVSPLPLLNAIPEVNVAIRQQGLKNIGILGTRLVMETGLYGGITSARTIAPDKGALELVHQSYIAMATVGRVTDAQRRIFLLAGEAMARNGAEAILLGGTDLFLAFDAFDCSFPVIDSTEIHLDAIYRRLTE